jgi:hypothetical protein
VITAAERRRIQVVLLAAAAVIVAFWAAWYADRSLLASNHRAAYYEFENAFPLADGWLALCCVAAAWALQRAAASALLWLLMAGGAAVYLFGMDVLYDLEHGIWWRSGAGGAIELVINIVTLAVALLLLRWTWERRSALLGAG